MPNTLYTITAELHELIQAKAKKFEVVIKIKNNLFYDTVAKNFDKPELSNPIRSKEEIFHFLLMSTDRDQLGRKRFIEVIEAPQIRQILLAFKEVLGHNPEYIEWQNKNESFKDVRQSISYNTIQVRKLIAFIEFRSEQNPIMKQAEALCTKWLDSLTPLIDREPETVLSELLEVLKAL